MYLFIIKNLEHIKQVLHEKIVGTCAENIMGLGLIPIGHIVFI